MASGVEIAGLTLAVLPLVVGRVTEYAKGVDSMKMMFSRRRYSRELRMYCTSIGVQHSILKDSMTKLLQDCVGFEDEINEMLQSPGHELWADPEIERGLKAQLGDDYDNFKANMTVVHELLSELKNKLGIASHKKSTPDDVKSFEEIKRIKHVFEFDIYEKLCSNLETANSQLSKLVEISIQRNEQSKRNKWKGKSFERHKRLRRKAKSIHNVMVNQSQWKCICKKKHLLNFQLSMPEEKGCELLPATFRMRCGIPVSAHHASDGMTWIWRDLETTAVDVLGSANASFDTISLRSNTSNRNARVKFATAATSSPSASSTTTTLIATDVRYSPKIDCLCTSLKGCIGKLDKEMIGYLEDNRHPDIRHEAYIVQDAPRDHTVRTLAETLACPSQTAQWLRNIPSARLPLQHRLMIAAQLAYATFQLHGSWMPQHWTTEDVVFVGHDISDCPYISWKLPQSSEQRLKDSTQVGRHVLVPSQTLFPLGLVLAQLALCKTLEELRQPEDENSDEIVTALSTASRVLPAVEWECGKQYFMATQNCLRWCGETDKGMDNEYFQRAVFDTVVKPLVECLEIFKKV